MSTGPPETAESLNVAADRAIWVTGRFRKEKDDERSANLEGLDYVKERPHTLQSMILASRDSSSIPRVSILTLRCGLGQIVATNVPRVDHGD
jgi:hypothetical protein